MHDEIDLPFGDMRARIGGGLAGHNGLKSLKAELGGPTSPGCASASGAPTRPTPRSSRRTCSGAFRQSRAEVAELIDDAARVAEAIVLGERELEARPSHALTVGLRRVGRRAWQTTCILRPLEGRVLHRGAARILDEFESRTGLICRAARPTVTASRRGARPGPPEGHRPPRR